MSGQNSDNIFVYYDTNVLAYISAGEVPDFLDTFAKLGAKHITSDTALHELLDGQRTRVFFNHTFQYVFSHEAVFIGGRINFYNSIEQPADEIETDALELFLRSLLRSTAGSRSVTDLNTLFRSGMGDVVDSIVKELPDGTDPRIVAKLTQARGRLFNDLDLLPKVPTPIVSKEEMDAHKMGPKYLGNIKPPQVIAKIREIYPDASEWLNRLVAPFIEDEDIRSRIQELCLALIMAGFARDRGIAKDDHQKSDQAARAQFQDISHICAAAVCDLFITADKRCAKLAYAVFEALKFKTEVIHLRPGQRDEVNLGSGLIDHIQKMTMAAMAMADMNVWAQRS